MCCGGRLSGVLDGEWKKELCERFFLSERAKLCWKSKANGNGDLA
jgi:hypothetical protein